MLDIKYIIWAIWRYLQIKYFLIAFFLPQMTHFDLPLFLTRFDQDFTLLFHEFIYYFSGSLMMSDDGQMIFRDLVGLKLPDICLTGEEKPRKNLTQEICPDRGSNPGLLHDTHACYRLAHSGRLS